MDDFDDYVAQQAARRAQDQEEKAEQQRQVQEEAEAFRRRSDETFQQVVMLPLHAAAKALKQHVHAAVESSRPGVGLIATLHIGHQSAPRRAILQIRQDSLVYTIKAEGPARVEASEKTVGETALPAAVEDAIKDVTDRWFGTNAYRSK